MVVWFGADDGNCQQTGHFHPKGNVSAKCTTLVNDSKLQEVDLVRLSLKGKTGLSEATTMFSKVID